MAEPTMAEKIAAAKDALDVLGAPDADDSLMERTIAVFWSQVALRQNAPVDPEMIRAIVREEIAAVVPPASTEPPVLVTTMLKGSGDPVEDAELKELNDLALALLRKRLMAVTE